MARTKGIASFPANFEPEVAGSFDARELTQFKSDLTNPTTWQANDLIIYAFVGMKTLVYADPIPENNGWYYLSAPDYTNIDNWVQIGSPLNITPQSKIVFDIIGNGITTEFTFVHNLNTREIKIDVYQNFGDYENVILNISRPSLNEVKITFAIAPIVDENYKVIII
jgi:hypothetical protein